MHEYIIITHFNTKTCCCVEMHTCRIHNWHSFISSFRVVLAVEDSHLEEAVVDLGNQEVVDLGVQVVVDLGIRKVVDLAAHVVDLAMETVNKMVLMTTRTKMEEIGEVLDVEGEEALKTLAIEMGVLGALVGRAEGAGVALVEVMTVKVALENQRKMVAEALVVVVVLGVGGAEEAEVGLVEVMTGKVALENQRKMATEALVVVVVLDVGGAEGAGVGLVEVMTEKVDLENQRKMVTEALVVVVVLDVGGAEEAEVGLEEAGILKEKVKVGPYAYSPMYVHIQYLHNCA